jgi:outer membrane protein assembly factor BamB
MVYCTSGFRGNILQAIELGRTGDLSGTDMIRWEINKNTPYVPSPLLFGDKIYLCTGNKEVVSCYEAQTGKAIFESQPLPDLDGIYSSPVGVADRVYVTGRNGKTAVIKHSDTFELLAVNTLDDKIDASLAIVGDALFLKGKTYLYCISNK